ncbi:hypothetical protein GMMP1_480018 [Candidatus Magnetomoraceae bacterium gMMP-1]
MNSDLNIDRYKQLVKDPDEETRIETYYEISDLGVSEYDDILINGLADSSPRVRSVVANIMSEIAHENMVITLLELLRVEEPSLRSRAMNILSRLGRKALKPIKNYLKDDDPDVRIFATNVLGNIGSKDTFSALIQLLNDDEENVRYAAVESLGKIGEKKAIPYLLDMLKDEWARYPAIESLGLLRAADAVPDLLKLYEEDEWIRHAVIEAFGNIRQPDLVDFLIQEMDTDNEMIYHAVLIGLSKIEQTNSCGAFEKMKEKRSHNWEEMFLSALEKHEPELRISAIRGLTLIGNERHIPFIVGQLNEFDQGVKDEACQALIKLGSKQIDALLAEYERNEESIQEALLEIFGKIGDKRAIPVISKGLESENKKLRKKAITTLFLFKDSSLINLFIKYLDDPALCVKCACIHALGVFRAVKASRCLISYLVDDDSELMEAASEALGNIGTTEIVTHVVPLLKHKRNDLRQAAVQCLGLILNPRVNSYLIDALNNSDRGVRRFAANILGKRKIIDALNPLITALLDEDWQVRKSAASALGEYHDHRCLDSLIDSLKDENIWVRYASVISLGNIPDEKALKPLRECLKNEPGPVKIGAMETLRKLNDPKLISMIIPLTEDSDEEIRKAAVWNLTFFKNNSSVISILQKMKNDPIHKIQSIVKESLNDI